MIDAIGIGILIFGLVCMTIATVLNILSEGKDDSEKEYARWEKKTGVDKVPYK